MKKLTALFLSGMMVLSLFMLSGCSNGTPEGTPLPEGMDEATVLSEGRKVVDLLVKEDYWTVVDQMRPDIGAGIAPGDVKDLMESVEKKAGEYVEETNAMATGQKNKEAGETLAEAVIFAKHEKKQVRYRIVFDPEMNLVGLQVRKY